MLTHFAAAAVEFLYDLYADLISLLSSIKRENTLIKEVLRQPWKNGKKTPSLRDEMEAWEENPEFGPSSSSWDSIFFLSLSPPQFNFWPNAILSWPVWPHLGPGKEK